LLRDVKRVKGSITKFYANLALFPQARPETTKGTASSLPPGSPQRFPQCKPIPKDDPTLDLAMRNQKRWAVEEEQSDAPGASPGLPWPCLRPCKQCTLLSISFRFRRAFSSNICLIGSSAELLSRRVGTAHQSRGFNQGLIPGGQCPPDKKETCRMIHGVVHPVCPLSAEQSRERAHPIKGRLLVGQALA